MRTSWNDEEDAALQGLPLDAQVLYLRALRRRMDYRTGMVGNLPGVNGISWRILADDLFVEPHQGISGGKPDESKVRRLMKWLVTRGLVVDQGTGRNLIFFLAKASVDESEQKKADRKPTGSRQGLADMENVIQINGFDYEADRKPTGGCVRKADTIPESGIREETPPTPSRGTRDQKPRKPRSAFVKPTPAEVQAYCDERQNGISGQVFCDSNDAKGWVVGKNQTPMQDWRAAVRTWEASRKERAQAAQPQQQNRGKRL